MTNPTNNSGALESAKEIGARVASKYCREMSQAENTEENLAALVEAEVERLRKQGEYEIYSYRNCLLELRSQLCMCAAPDNKPCHWCGVIDAAMKDWEIETGGASTPSPNLRAFIYRCVKELDYVQSSFEACGSNLCASATGKGLVDEGMKLLGVKDLSTEDLPSTPSQTSPAPSTK